MNRKVEDILANVYDDFFGTKTTAKTDPDEIARKAKAMRESIESEFDLSALTELDKTESTLNNNQKKTDAGKKNSHEKGEPNSLEKTSEKSEASEETKSVEEEKPEKPKVSPMEELNNLIGMDDIKEDVKELVNLVKMQKLREEKGLKTVPVSLHLVFTGNPGTGKTTIARILAGLYKEIGVLSKGQLVEVDRSSLVAGFVGQTATKTQEKLQEAMGGVLFIDEAYTLVKDAGNDFGQEAIDTILKTMEDHRDDLIVIVAGYPDLMQKFINSNPGLKSRFNKYFHFADYSVDELEAIFAMYTNKYDYKLGEDVQKMVKEKIEQMVAEKDENFANARSVRNMFESIITNQASRVAKIETPNDEDVVSILPADIEGL